MSERFAEEYDGSGSMFDKIAANYDKLNRVISFGLDQGWRTRLIRRVDRKEPLHILDLATGTGDVAIALLHAFESVAVVGLDPSEEMLRIAQQKSEKNSNRVSWTLGNAENIPFKGSEFDAVTMAFGIRNVRDRDKALREMARVTRDGGQVLILELTEPQNGLMASVAKFHIHRWVPMIASAISDVKAYEYLQQSIAAFPSVNVFCSMMERAGIAIERTESLTMGACHLFVGRVQKKHSIHQ